MPTVQRTKSLLSQFLAVPLALATLAAACAGESAEDGEGTDRAVDTEASPNYGLEVTGDVTPLAEASQGNLTTKWYEIEPGHILEIDYGKAGEQPAMPAELSSVQRYALMTGREPPAALAAAQKRENDMRSLRRDDARNGTSWSAEPGFDGAPEQHDKGGTSPQPAPDQTWFRNNYCFKTDRNYFEGDRQTDILWNGSGINYRKVGVFCSSGTIRVRLMYSTGTLYEYFVTGYLAAGWYAASRESSTRNATVGDMVYEVANGDKYDFCTNYHF